MGVPEVVQPDHRPPRLPQRLAREHDLAGEAAAEPLGVPVCAVEVAEPSAGSRPRSRSSSPRAARQHAARPRRPRRGRRPGTETTPPSRAPRCRTYRDPPRPAGGRSTVVDPAAPGGCGGPVGGLAVEGHQVRRTITNREDVELRRRARSESPRCTAATMPARRARGTRREGGARRPLAVRQRGGANPGIALPRRSGVHPRRVSPSAARAAGGQPSTAATATVRPAPPRAPQPARRTPTAIGPTHPVVQRHPRRSAIRRLSHPYPTRPWEPSAPPRRTAGHQGPAGTAGTGGSRVTAGRRMGRRAPWAPVPAWSRVEVGTHDGETRSGGRSGRWSR